MQPARIGQHVDRGELPLQGDTRGLEPPGQAVRGHGGDAGQVVPAQRELQGGGLGGGQGLQVADHPGQPQHLVPQRRQLLLGRLGHAVQQRLVAGLQDRDRRPQLVRDVGDQVAAELLLPVQGVGHQVEGGRQLADLAGGGDRPDPGRAVPLAHRPGHGDQPFHRPGDAPGHAQAR